MNKEIEEVCKKHGFDFQLIENGMLITKPKDIWDGVEFFQWHTGVISRMTDSIKKDLERGIKLLIQPSTEQAYIKQLKKEAFERFGEIKEGDRFDRTGIKELWGVGEIEFHYHFVGFHYNKDSDRLYFNNLCIYEYGKWATRVKERVKVDFDGGNLQSRQFYFLYGKDAESKMQEKGCFKVGQSLASQLEKYLNGEV